MERASKLNREIWGIIVFAFALLVGLSLFSYDPADRSVNTPSGNLGTHNWGGVAGAYVADLLLQGFGLSAYLFCLFLFLVSFNLFRNSLRAFSPTKVGGSALSLWSVAILLSLARPADLSREAGGILGDLSKEFLVSFFSPVGGYVIVLCTFVLSLMFLTQGSVVAALNHGKRGLEKSRKLFAAELDGIRKSWRLRGERRRAENTRTERRDYVPPPIVLSEEVKEEAPRRPRKKSPPVQPELPLPEFGQGYKLPSPSLLDPPDSQHVEIDKETLNAIGVTLQKKLADLGVDGQVKSVHPGPVITMFKFEPAAGVKVRRIITLADDLAMALRALNVRILAPIPGESVVGIEIPNPRREKVFLQQVIGSEDFQNAESKLTLALGKTISGLPYLADLARMPHLLVAGATGTGKSVSINAMILSMLYKATPKDVQFIMIDPKMLELTVYEEIPHLLVPVVTDPKKAAAALFWAMDEMDRRYRLMRDKGARNIDHYNRRILERKMPDKGGVIDLKDPEETGESDKMTGHAEEQSPPVHEHLPRIVIVVDELADMMMSVGRDIEEYITRLAQKARAAGIHMILATQRPSVDVITGLIKANFPARISFQVTSRVDSRTILDSIGAERLLGNGDMLFLPPGTARITRVHGAYVSDQEVREVAEFIRQQAKPRYRPEVFEAKKEIEAANGDDDYDEMYDQAVAIVAEEQQASISMIQRRLRVGYNRAARMIEQMERDGVVGPSDGAKPREVYARKLEG
ncbi:MAG: DNA translocase FtsK 4TM domain-containing protein [Deltaproteobacteria bacterium]|nr:DNA translocase FtsK 4TM domain-containing protein [Deltaproteobacteria bacterium]